MGIKVRFGTVALAAAVMVSGCMSMGREISADQFAQLEKGKTTIDEATRLLGPPNVRSLMPDGRVTLGYSYAHAQARPASFIPIVGLFAGGSDVRSSMTTLVFHNGILETASMTEANQGVGTGFSSAPYEKPDYTQPAAAR